MARSTAKPGVVATKPTRSQARRERAAEREADVDDVSLQDAYRLRELFGAGEETTVGIDINEQVAFTFSAANRAVQLISSSMAVMPIKIYRKRMKDGKVVGREEAEHPAADIVGWSPDGGETSSYMWRETQTAHASMRGNGISELVRNNRGQGMFAYNLDPRRVSFDKSNGQRRYKVMDANGQKTLLPSQVIHIPAISWDGWIGRSPISDARETIGLALITEKYGNTFFRKGGRPLGFLTKPNTMTKTQRENTRQEWRELHEGIRNFLNVGVLSGGLGWQSIGFTPEDCQFLLTRKFQIEEIARWFGVPPHMLASMDNAKYSNIEQMLLEFMMFTLFPWIKRWEGELNLKLFTPKEAFTYYAEFNFDSLLRTDLKSKTEAINALVKAGLRTPDEGRALDNLDAYPDGIGAQPLVQGNNMLTLKDVIEGKTLLTPGGTSGNMGGQNDPSKGTDPANPQQLFSRLCGMCALLDSQAMKDLRDILDVMVRGKTQQQLDAERS